MATPIIPRLVRGRLYFHSADVQFPSVTQVGPARAGAEAHQLSLVDASGGGR